MAVITEKMEHYYVMNMKILSSCDHLLNCYQPASYNLPATSYINVRTDRMDNDALDRN
jgi:hypothetical protein